MINSHQKIVFGGPMGAGKSQAISALSEISVFTTEELNTDTEANSKLLTTIGIDYGRIYINQNQRVELYGTPGQHRFNFTWPIISKGASCIVLLIDHSASSPLTDLEFYIKAFGSLSNNVVIAVTHSDLDPDFSLNTYKTWLLDNNHPFKLLRLDPRQKEHMLKLLDFCLPSQTALEAPSNIAPTLDTGSNYHD